jgi:hypothetical protein
MAVGRISGPLLKDNLLRNGVNLAFETSLLYLDVVNSRIGINTTQPAYDLDVNGTTRSNNLYATTQANLATFTISGNTISSSSNTINFTPTGANPTVLSAVVNVGNLNLTGNVLSSTNTNGAITLQANGTGAINLNSNVLITGSLHATGTITADGNIQLGDQPTDTISFTGEVNSNILPATTNTYNLGSTSLRWKTIYAQTATVTNFTVTTLTTPSISTPNLTISGNSITATTSNTDISFVTSGTGGVSLGNFKFYQNSVTNTATNAVSQFASTGAGYYKITGTYGVVIPVGTNAQRPALAYEEPGMIRFNTDLGLVEVYNGTVWGSVAGNSVGVTAATGQDIGVQTALLLG